MFKLLTTLRYTATYATKSTFYGWKVVYNKAHDAWAIMKDGKVYCMDTKESCYKYVSLV